MDLNSFIQTCMFRAASPQLCPVSSQLPITYLGQGILVVRTHALKSDKPSFKAWGAY